MMMINASTRAAEIEQQSREEQPSQTQLVELAKWSSRITSPDEAVMRRVSLQASELVPLCDWRAVAEELLARQSPTANWLAASLFEAGGEFETASAVLDSFSFSSSRSAESLRLLTLARTRIQCEMKSMAVAPLKRAIRLSESYRSLNACGKVLKSLERTGVVSCARNCRVAMLGNATFDFVLPTLKTVAFASGINLMGYTGAYNQHAQEILDDASALHAFRPEVIILANDYRWLAIPEESNDPDGLVAQKVAEITRMWDVAATRFQCHIIQHNYVIPEVSAYGGLSGRLPGGQATLIRKVNLALAREAAKRANVSMLDVEQIASVIGKRVWDDARMWLAAKQYPASDAIPLLAIHEVALLRAILGLSAKCLVLDLDNTLWGGVIGEDGLDGIRLGGGAEGEAFVAFQRYIKTLRERGVILAVCSKNDESEARLPFQTHPEMVLGMDDISVFTANWAPKTENLLRIAKELNIGIDSLVFVDDNPAERDLVRRELPEIEVPELPPDPALYVEALHRELLFETLTLTSEDKERAESYRANLSREVLLQSSASLDSFLRSLQMDIKIAPCDEANLPRVVQLINKTNQFNLTTRRMTAEQVQAAKAVHGSYTQFVHLRDRFGDNGITGVLIASPQGDALSIDVWLISCRVLGRQVEDTMLASLWNFAYAHGYKALLGTYIPSAKNNQVADLYERMGFMKVSDGAGGERIYRAELESRRAFPAFFEVTDLTSQEVS